MVTRRILDEQHSRRSAIYDASLIPLYGFGKAKVIRTENNIRTEESIDRIYKLNCGCLIREYSECGSVCAYCLLELEATLRSLAPAQMEKMSLTQEQLNWLCTPCRNHQITCSMPFCGRTCCSRHSARDDNGMNLCLEHFLALDTERQKTEQGLVLFKTRGFIKSLFQVDEETESPR